MTVESGDRKGTDRWTGLLRRYWWVLVLNILIASCAAAFLANGATATYRSTADVLLSNRDLAALLTGTQANVAPDPQRAAETQSQVARSPVIVTAALKRADADDLTVQQFLDASSVTTSLDSDILTFGVTDELPARSQTLASAYAREYAAYRLDLDTAAINNARKALAGRIAELRTTGDNASLISTLEAKDQELQTLAALQTSNAYVVKESTSASKVGPKPLQAIVLGFLAGIVTGILNIALLGFMDTRVRDVDVIAGELGLPEIGRVPSSKRPLEPGANTATITPANSPMGEAYRSLRNNLRFVVSQSSSTPVLAITSASPGEGKTTTALNLGAALARAGATVAVIDLDLRRPRLAKAVGLVPYPGVTDVCVGQASLEESLATVPIFEESSILEGASASEDIGGLFVLPAGTPPPNPGEMVISKGVKKIVNALREDMDFVLIDTPPLGRVADAVAISDVTDGLIIVARRGYVQQKDLRSLTRALQAAKGTAVGVILNGVGKTGRYDYGDYSDSSQGRGRPTPTEPSSIEEQFRQGVQKPFQN